MFDLSTAVVGKESRVVRVFLGWVAVEEGVERVTVPVDVDYQSDWVGFVESMQVFLERVYLAMVVLPRLSPYSIEIVSREVGSVVAAEDTVNVDHWHHVEMIVFLPSVKVSFDEPFDHTFGYIRALRLPRVLSGHEDNARQPLLIATLCECLCATKILLALKLPWSEAIDIKRKASESFSYLSFFYFETTDCPFDHHLVEESLQIKKIVGKRVGKGYNIVLIGTLVFEVKAVVMKILVVFSGNRVGGIRNVVASFRPAETMVEFVILGEVSHGHSFLVEGASFSLSIPL